MKVYTDGSSDNPGRSGWGAVILLRDGSKQDLGGTLVHGTTAPQSELFAVLNVLCWMNNGPPCMDGVELVEIYTDCLNVVKWLRGEQKRKNPKIDQICRQIEAEGYKLGKTLEIEFLREEESPPETIKRAHSIATSYREGMGGNRTPFNR